MSMDGATFRSQSSVIAVVVVMIAAAAGCWAFLVSLRPCRLQFDPGTLISYSLRSEYADDNPEAKSAPRVDEKEISLICIGHDNEVALVSPGAGKKREEITLLNFSPNGTARRYEPNQTVSDDGKALGFFDFNLMPLPPGSEQNWSVNLNYAALPEAKRQVQAKVRRISNSSRPEFQLKLPTIEWVNDQKRYQQIRDLTCTYRFNTGKGIIESASLRCLASTEREDGCHRIRVRIDLGLIDLDHGSRDIGALRDLALATAEAQAVPSRDRDAYSASLLRRLADDGSANPKLRAIAQQLSGAAPSPSASGDSPFANARVSTPSQWGLQVCSADNRGAADLVAQELADSGLRASVLDTGKRLLVCAGPFDRQDPQVYAAVMRRYSANKPYWVKWPQ
jgi:hypothetical protein